MNTSQLQRLLHQMQAQNEGGSAADHLQAAMLLIDAARLFLQHAQASLQESTGTTARSRTQGRETELDPKPPLKPVTVAAPSKTKYPKYSGNHAPSAQRR